MNYRTYIDLGEGYFEVFIIIPEFTKELESGEMFLRYKWGQLKIRNMPDMYKATGNIAYMLYDLIYDQQFSTEIKIKVEYEDITIYGVISSNKCEYKHDRTNKVLMVTPKTLDKYTNFLDNIENEIDLISGNSTSTDNNLIQNGDFDEWLSVNLDGVLSNAKNWTILNGDPMYLYGTYINPLEPIGGFITSLDTQVMEMFDTSHLKESYTGLEGELPNYTGIAQKCEKVIAANTNVSISFKYNNVFYENHFLQYWKNESEKTSFRERAISRQYRRKYMLSIAKKIESWEQPVRLWWDADSNSWVATADNNLHPRSGIINYFTEFEDIVLLPDEVTEMHVVDILTSNVPFDCELTIIFLGEEYLGSWVESGQRGYFATSLLLDNVTIYSDTSLSKLVKIPLSTDNLRPKQIFALPAPFDCLRATVLLSDWEAVNKDTRHYFNADGSPNYDVMKDRDGSYGFYLSDKGDKTIEDWETSFRDDPTSQQKYGMYQGQLCELTIYEGEYYPTWTKIRAKQRIFGEATFAREEYYKVDEYDEDGERIPPQPNAGWKEYGYINDKGERLWVRIPYNGSYNDWVMDAEETFGEWHVGNPNGFRCQKKRTSRRQYPSIATPIEINSGIDLRDVFRMVFHVTHDDYKDKEVYSNFLWNSHESELPLLASHSGINYVTMAENFLNNIVCIHTYALKTESVSTDDVNKRLVFSFKTFFDDFRTYFKKYNYGELYYYLDDDLNLHVEHVKYIDLLATTVDIRDRLIRPNYMFSYDTAQFGSKYKYTQQISGYADFANNIVEFTPIVGDNNSELITYSPKLLTTDLRYCVENPADIDNGLILINHLNYVALSTPVQIGKTDEINGNLSLSNLLDKFGRYEGTWITGTINGELKYFENILRAKKGEQITIKGIVDHPFMTTNIGNGFVVTMIHDFNKKITRVTLIYKTEFVLMASKYLESENEVDAEIYLDIQ